MVAAYYRHRRVTDLVVSVLICLLYASGTLEKGSFLAQLSENDLRNILLYLFSTSASLVGFVLAAGTFLTSHVRDATFSILRESKSYQQLGMLIFSAIWRLLGLSIASLIMLIAGPRLIFLAQIAVVFFVPWSMMSLAAMTWIVTQIILVPVKP